MSKITVWCPVVREVWLMRDPTTWETIKLAMGLPLPEGATRCVHMPDIDTSRLKGQWEAQIPQDCESGSIVATHCRVTVDEEDLPAVNVVDERDVSHRDKKLMGLFASAGGRQDGNAAGEAYLAAMVTDKASASEKEDAKFILVQAAQRGLDPAKAQAVIDAKALPSAQKGAGVDREILEASAGFVQRARKISDPADAAELVVGYVRGKGL